LIIILSAKLDMSISTARLSSLRTFPGLGLPSQRDAFDIEISRVSLDAPGVATAPRTQGRTRQQLRRRPRQGQGYEGRSVAPTFLREVICLQVPAFHFFSCIPYNACYPLQQQRQQSGKSDRGRAERQKER